MNKCDMCGSKIVDGKCDCGEWKTGEEIKDNPIKIALEHFHVKGNRIEKLENE